MLNTNLVIEFLAMAVSLWFFKDLQKGKLRSLPFFLMFIFLIEFFGRFLKHELGKSNNWLYNISIPIEYLYYMYLFFLHGQQLLRSTTKFAGLVIICVCIFYLLTKPITKLHLPVLVVGEVSTVIVSCAFVYEAFTKDTEMEKSLLRFYFFWIVAGLLLFNLGDVCFFGLYPIIKSNGWDKFDKLFRSINNNLLILLNCCYIISIFIFSKYGKERDVRIL
jgi:hypothetical protein